MGEGGKRGEKGGRKAHRDRARAVLGGVERVLHPRRAEDAAELRGGTWGEGSTTPGHEGLEKTTRNQDFFFAGFFFGCVKRIARIRCQSGIGGRYRNGKRARATQKMFSTGGGGHNWHALCPSQSI